MCTNALVDDKQMHIQHKWPKQDQARVTHA